MPEIAEVARMTDYFRKKLLFPESINYDQYIFNNNNIEENKNKVNVQLMSIHVPPDSNLSINDYSDLISKLPLRVNHIFSFAKKMLIEFTNNLPTEKEEEKNKIKNDQPELSILLFEFGMAGNFDKGATRLQLNFKINTQIDDAEKFQIVTIDYKNDRKIRSIIDYYPTKGLYLKYINSKFAPDCFSISYSTFHKKIKTTRALLHNILKSQKLVVSGIGNYLRADIIYKSEISPFRKGNTLTSQEIKRLYLSMKSIVRSAYDQGGCTLHTFSIDGKDGNYQPLVYECAITNDQNKCIVKRCGDSEGFNPTLWWVPGNEI